MSLRIRELEGKERTVERKSFCQRKPGYGRPQAKRRHHDGALLVSAAVYSQEGSRRSCVPLLGVAEDLEEAFHFYDVLPFLFPFLLSGGIMKAS